MPSGFGDRRAPTDTKTIYPQVGFDIIPLWDAVGGESNPTGLDKSTLRRRESNLPDSEDSNLLIFQMNRHLASTPFRHHSIAVSPAVTVVQMSIPFLLVPLDSAPYFRASILGVLTFATVRTGLSGTFPHYTGV